MSCVEKIINSVGLQFDRNIEVQEFHNTIEATKEVESEEKQDPIELNSSEFFIQALTYFAG